MADTTISDTRELQSSQLDLIGTNRRSLFPDLDGLAQYYRWRTSPELSKLGLVKN